jgi:hypothetical protein
LRAGEELGDALADTVQQPADVHSLTGIGGEDRRQRDWQSQQDDPRHVCAIIRAARLAARRGRSVALAALRAAVT